MSEDKAVRLAVQRSSAKNVDRSSKHAKIVDNNTKYAKNSDTCQSQCRFGDRNLNERFLLLQAGSYIRQESRIATSIFVIV